MPEERQAVAEYWRQVAEVTPADDPSDPRNDPL
jgi:hypothetical protein